LTIPTWNHGTPTMNSMTSTSKPELRTIAKLNFVSPFTME